MTKQEILKLITYNPETKTIIIKHADKQKKLDLSIKVENNISGSVNMKNIDGNNDQLNIEGYNSQGDIGGNNEQGSVGGWNYQDNIGESNSQSIITGYNSQLDIGGYNRQGNIGGNNEQKNIGGWNNQYNIGRWNHQQNIGEYNSQKNIGWYNEQYNITNSNRQWNIGGNNEQRIVKGHSYNSKHYVLGRTKTTNIDFTDDVLLYSIKKKPLKNGVEYIEGTSINGYKIWLVKNNFIGYHSSKNLEDAKKGFQKKLKLFKEGIVNWVKTLKDESIITDKLFHEKTGSCLPGIKAWKETVGISELKEISFGELKELFVKHPTRETRKVMAALEYIKNKGEIND